MEVSFREFDLDELSFLSYNYNVDGQAKTLSFMANAWYNVPFSANFSGYAGAGMGVSQGEASFPGYDEDFSGEFTWQAGVGVEFRTDSGYTFGVGYRYVDIPNVGDDGLTSNDFMAVLSKRY